MIQAEVESVTALLEASQAHLKGFGQTVHWFRGQASTDWKLIPRVHREYDAAGEHNLAARFTLSAPTRYQGTPDLKDLSTWICLMQHFGLPTRLLDWTASPLVALYFAVNSEPNSGSAAVWALVPSTLNATSQHRLNSILVLSGPEARPLLEAGLRGGPPIDDILAVMGKEVDLRMTVQQGTFTIHGTDVPLESRAGSENYLAKFVVPDTARKRLQEELWFLGVRRSILFPDLSNLAQDLATDDRLVPRNK